MNPASESDNPLLTEDPAVWDDLIAGLDPASLLVLIEMRSSRALLARHSAEDILQSALAHLWRDRAKLEWRGRRAFRNLFLTIVDNRIRDLAERENAQKRGGGNQAVNASVLCGVGSGDGFMPACASTTPGAALLRRERAGAMLEALDALPEDHRYMVRMRLLEQRPMADIAQEMGIGLSAAYRLFRRAAELYEQQFAHSLGSRTDSRGRERDLAEKNPADPSPTPG